ncbi:TIGR01777 family protein [Halostreptopolyspora alba]|uniref:TIGR01777 family protein n=1 Tax=Halostreptopolyspora alba TaxID=2487137 RepID=A0A3N0E1V6_9ACTN|nr:TIGR01777 family protein [Nocardiopsaceae bacterium YIM 96095]
MAITGASGLIGTQLGRSLTASGQDVLRFVRRPARDAAEVRWDPEGGYVDTERLTGVEAVVHLAGEPVGPARWTTARKRRIWDSRVRGTRTLATALAAMDAPPPRLLSGSAIGYYGNTGAATADERTPAGAGFLADLCVAWEGATEPAQRAGISVAHMRSANVLSASGGLLGFSLPAFRMGLGARLGSGQQHMSWISLPDEVGAIRFLLDHPDLQGPFNLCAPNPVSNAAFTAAVARAVRRPAVLAVPGFALRAALAEFADEGVLVDQSASPERLREAGYTFEHADLRAALRDLL